MSTHARTARTCLRSSPSPATVAGAGWSATGPALPAGVYTVQVTQTDWAGNTASVTRGIETRNAVFVSTDRQRREFGYGGGAEADDPGRGQHGRRCEPPASGCRSGNVWSTQPHCRAERHDGEWRFRPVRRLESPGHSRFSGYGEPGPHQHRGCAGRSRHQRHDGSDPRRPTDQGLERRPACWHEIYGVRAVGGSDVTLQNVKVIADNGVDGTSGTSGTSGASATPGVEGTIGGETCSGNHAGGAAGTGGEQRRDRRRGPMQQQRARRCGRCRTGWGRWHGWCSSEPTLHL